jgi:hypothetical protein
MATAVGRDHARDVRAGSKRARFWALWIRGVGGARWGLGVCWASVKDNALRRGRETGTGKAKRGRLDRVVGLPFLAAAKRRYVGDVPR